MLGLLVVLDRVMGRRVCMEGQANIMYIASVADLSVPRMLE